MSGWYSWLGFWAMLHEPVHFVVFLILVATIPTEIYTLATVFVLYAYLKEAYIDVDIAIVMLKVSLHQVLFSVNSGQGSGGE